MLKANGVLNTEDREEEIKQIEVYKSHSKFMKTKVGPRVSALHGLNSRGELWFTYRLQDMKYTDSKAEHGKFKFRFKGYKGSLRGCLVFLCPWTSQVLVFPTFPATALSFDVLLCLVLALHWTEGSQKALLSQAVNMFKYCYNILLLA